MRGSGRFRGELKAAADEAARVSIPFIAGQWSLPPARRNAPVPIDEFQSPSLRGSGRFENDPALSSVRLSFQSPSLRGSGRFERGLGVASRDVL